MADFYKYADSEQVYNQQNEALSYDQYIAQGGLKDFSNVQTLTGQAAPQLLTSTQLAPQPKLDVPTSSPTTSEATAAAAGAAQTSKSLQDYMKEFTPPETPEQKQASDLTKSIQSLLEGTAGQAKALGEEENKLGLPELKKQLAQLNSDILTKNAEFEVSKQDYEKQISDAEDKVQSLSRIQGEQGRIARARATELALKASEIGLTQARALGLQGNIEAAQAAAKRAVDLRYASVLEQLDIKSKQLQALKESGILDKQEKIQALAIEAKYKDDQARIAEEKAKSKSNLDLALTLGLTTQFANRNGEFFNVRTGKTYATQEEFFKDAGVKSFAEAYQRGLVSNIDNATIIGKQQVGQLMAKYWDAGITMADSMESAQKKLARSKIYQHETRIPGMGGGRSGTAGLSIPGIGQLTNTQIDNISPVVTAFRNEPIVQNYNTIAEGYQFVQSLSDTTTNPADDQALIYALAKALDPGSVVREGEYATAQKYAQSLVASYGKSVTQALSGTGFLSQQARQNIKATINSRFQAAARNYENVYNETARRVELVGGLPQGTGTQFLNNYSGGYTVAPTQVPTSPAPSTYSVSNPPPAPETRSFWSKVSNWLWGNN